MIVPSVDEVVEGVGHPTAASGVLGLLGVVVVGVVVVLLGEGGDRHGQQGAGSEHGSTCRQASPASVHRWGCLFVGHGSDREPST